MVGGAVARGGRTALPVLPNAGGARPISPTDVAQFIRLEQCERYLRLRLHERSANRRFLSDYGVAPQAIPPLLTRSGAAFEARVEQAVAARYAVRNFARETVGATRTADNARLVAAARALPAGETLVLFQPRLEVALGGWHLRGDVDLLRLERDGDGALRALVADMKSSNAARVEHRLQVAFYHEMLAALFAGEGLACAELAMAILYRGPGAEPPGLEAERARREAQRALAERRFGTRDAYLDLVADAEGYRDAVRDLVTGADSTAARVAAADFAAIPYHLSFKCDGCLYNEFCMKWSAEHDDLSLLPHLGANEKSALLREGVASMRELATLKEASPDGEGDPALIPAPGREALVQKLAATWPVGPRLDELIQRARRYRRWKGDDIEAFPGISGKGYGSLPYCDAEHNPNLVRVYLDAQHDYLHDRVYMLGALVVGCEGGEERPERRRSVVHLTAGPPETAEAERDLFLRWIGDTIRAVLEVAAPDAEGRPRAPIHLIFYNSFEQRLLLEGLARHFPSILGATPLYDFMTQLAAFDSPVATFLDREIQELKNYPMVCQSLPAVAAYLKFDWNAGTPYRELFRARLFDFWGKLDRPEQGASPWYTNRARFGSQIPLEYAYAAWGALPAPPTGGHDDYLPYRRASVALLRGFHARRLEAMERVARDFPGNKQTYKSPFDLAGLAEFAEKAHTLGQALDEFVTIERHVALGAWKSTRLAPPERRVLSGDTLIARYDEADQAPEAAADNREHLRRQEAREAYLAAARAANPDGERATLTKEQQGETRWSAEGLRLRLRLDTSGLDCGLDEALGLSTLRPGDSLVILPRTTVDSRLPAAEQVPFTPTPKQMLYGTRGTLARLTVERDGRGKALAAFAELELRPSHGRGERGFVFGSRDEPFRPGERYTLDPDPNDWYGSWCAAVTEALAALLPGVAGGHALYDRLAGLAAEAPCWPPAAADGQARFLAGLQALHQVGAFHDLEPSKAAYIGRHGSDAMLLVQGPPGTGKSYATAFALFARLQGALAADLDFRALVSCKTHAATDVLLENLVAAREKLRAFRQARPDIFQQYFDPRLLEVPLYRVRPRGTVPDGVTALARKEALPKGAPRAAEVIARERHCLVAATPGGVYGTVKERWPKALFGHALVDCLVLDEASQMNLPEALLAALLLTPAGRLIVVGDHRQMPPIVQHDWNAELRRTFQEFRAYESLFQTLLARGLPMIQFAESFRLHRDMAEFLRREVYAQDGIAYHSHNEAVLPACADPDPFVRAVLAPEQPIVVVVHDEAQSQVRNVFEQALITPVLRALAGEAGRGLGPAEGLGVVVPHRAQRAALQEALPALSLTDPATGAVTLSAVDTVERFQGSEREAIMVSATESDRAYLLASSEFLLDPRRLTVALSRAKRKMILVAAQSVFALFSADEETFAHAQLWKNLLRRTCTVRLWEGEREGRRVTVWGNGGPVGNDRADV